MKRHTNSQAGKRMNSWKDKLKYKQKDRQTGIQVK